MCSAANLVWRLRHIYNLSFSIGKFPHKMNVVIYKSGQLKERKVKLDKEKMAGKKLFKNIHLIRCYILNSVS